jgi:hypothetical protein
MTRSAVLRVLGSVTPQTLLIKDDQSTPDIIRQMLVKHSKCKGDYDKICYLFAGGTDEQICKRLWDFCKQNLNYFEEPIESQYTSSPGTILRRGYSDCKCYALFIAGVLDALNRTGYAFRWSFRFASYKMFNASPGHVFVVVKDSAGEMWIDPVLGSFDEHRGYYYAKDKRPVKGSSMGRLGCINCSSETLGGLRPRKLTLNKPLASMGTGAATGQLIDKAAPALAMIPVVGDLAAALGEVVGTFLIVFGSKYSSNLTTGVRWLMQMYQYYVLGQAGVTSDSKVNAADCIPAQQWFSAVLGVPIYDKYPWHALRGENGDTGASLGQTNAQSANAYLAYPDVQKAGITYDQALEAVAIAKSMEYKGGDAPGIWASMPVAPALADSINAEIVAAQNTDTPTATTLTAVPASVSPVAAPVILPATSSIPWGLIAIAGVGILLLTSKKKTNARRA